MRVLIDNTNNNNIIFMQNPQGRAPCNNCSKFSLRKELASYAYSLCPHYCGYNFKDRPESPCGNSGYVLSRIVECI